MAAILGNQSAIIVSRRVDFTVSAGPLSKFKYNHPKIARILCVSEKIRTLTLPAVKDPLKVITVHSGIDFSRFRNKTATGILHREFKLPDSAIVIGNVAALAPHKDYGTFVKTAALLHTRFPDAYFFIIGEGNERRNIEEKIHETGLAGRIIMTGFRNDVPEILPELDVMLVTSETEGLGTSILDAFACSVPVVATVAGGIPEIVIHEQTGLLAVVGDTQSLAEQVGRVLNDPGLRSRIVQGAQMHLNEFTRAATASKTLTEYLAVTGSSL
jgi:glycosyltransferase involved in cell wall biosynthesis